MTDNDQPRTAPDSKRKPDHEILVWYVCYTVEMGDSISIGVYIGLFITLYFEVFVLMTFLETKPFHNLAENKARAPKRFPAVSIIVPCYNEERTIAKTLLSLLNLDYPKNKLKILVVDDGSTDNTWKTMQRFQGNAQVELYHKENGGKHTALNFALGNTETELVGCLDADSFVAKDALREIVKAFEDPEVMTVTPAIQPVEPKNLIQLIQKAEYSLSISIRHAFAHLNSIFIPPGPFSIFRREVFEKLGVYKVAFNTEDLEFGLRMQTHHLKIGNAPTAHVFTNTPQTLRALFRQRLRWTYGYLKNSMEYRFLFFKRGYGNLGMLVLPIATTAIFTALYFAFVFIYYGILQLIQKAVEMQVIGVQALKMSFDFDWFYVNTSASIFLILSIIIMVVILILFGKRLSNQSLRFPVDILVYMLLYGFLAPWWLARAVYNAALSKESSWTAERN